MRRQEFRTKAINYRTLEMSVGIALDLVVEIEMKMLDLRVTVSIGIAPLGELFQ
jgi:hypothetical protein